MRIRVTPQYLKGKKQEWEAIVRQAEKGYREAEERAEQLKEYLGTGPAEQLQKAFAEKGQKGEQALKGLLAQIAKLEEIAEVYSRAERSNTNVTADN